KKEGKGVLVFKSNSIIVANYKDDKINGRAINIWPDGSTITDCNYADDNRNGDGYQYEIKNKRLFEGTWRNDKWVQAGTINFSSFLKSRDFAADSNVSQMLMGPVNSRKLLTDTAYFYDLREKKRYFGYYQEGELKNGIVRADDSTVFWGAFNEKGATGYCYNFKIGKYYTEGIFINDILNGKCLDIDLAKKTVYFGDVVNGVFTGKAYFINGKGTMYAGDYKNGQFSGSGYQLKADGTYISGTWNNGEIVKLISLRNNYGEVIGGVQKSFAEGINSIVKSFPDDYEDIVGEEVNSSTDMDMLEEIYDIGYGYSYSIINIPGSIDKNMVVQDFDENDFYYAKFLQTDNEAKAKAKYNELAKQLQGVSLSGHSLVGKQKLNGKVVVPDISNDLTESDFTITGDSTDYSNFHIWLRLRKIDKDFVVEIMMGQKSDE
ncbi:MAG: hypothetical protein ABJA79_09800, partial [Parafilimonas sp.]